MPPRLQTRHGSVCFRGIHNDVTDRKRAGKGLAPFWTWPDPHWLSRNAVIINRQSEGGVSVHKDIAKLCR